MNKDFLNKILKLYASKRREEEVKESFEQLKQSFRECLKVLLESNISFESCISHPFAGELFDKYTECKYLATKEDGSIQEFKTLKECNDTKLYKPENVKFSIKMKESEKKPGNFIYYNQWWKSKHFEGRQINSFVISTDLGVNFIFDNDFTDKKFKESSFYLNGANNKFENAKLCESAIFIKPYNEMNLTAMPSWIKQIDKGTIVITESTEIEKKIDIAGNNIKGSFVARREHENMDFWVLRESKHSHDNCMECSNKPKYEVLWAEGIGHAWFCKSHLKSWAKEHKDDICSVKEVQENKAASKFAENTNPNIEDVLLKELLDSK